MREGQLSSLITEKLKTVAENVSLQRQRKAFATLLPYAIRLERNGQPEVFEVFLQATEYFGMPEFVWHHVEGITSLLREATPRAIVLLSPSIPLSWLMVEEGSIQLWVAAVSAVQDTEGVAESVVETLLRIASEKELLQHITVEIWSWLMKLSYPPLFELGHSHRSYQHVVKAVRGLRDIETLKRYFLLVWSGGNTLPDDGFDETCASLREDFGGVGLGHHRFDLIEKLDRILKSPSPTKALRVAPRIAPRISLRITPSESRLPQKTLSSVMMERRLSRKIETQYRGLKDVLLETNIYRTPYLLITLLCLLTQDALGSREIFMCAFPLPHP